MVKSACLSCPKRGKCDRIVWDSSGAKFMTVVGCDLHPDQKKYKGHSTTVVLNNTLGFPSLDANSAVYNTAWTAVNGAWWACFLGQIFNAGSYYVERYYEVFDTSGIPASAVVSAGIIELYTTTVDHADDWKIQIQTDQPAHPSDPPVAADFDKTSYGATNGGVSDWVSTFTAAAYNSVPMNATGFTWVKTGVGAKTKLCLRSTRDIAGTAPTALEYVLTGQFAGVNLDKITITYTAGVQHPGLGKPLHMIPLKGYSALGGRF